MGEEGSCFPNFNQSQAKTGANVTTLALTGRVPCKVTGIVHKGDMMVSAGNGRARAEKNPAIKDLVEQIKQKEDQIKMVTTLLKSSGNEGLEIKPSMVP